MSLQGRPGVGALACLTACVTFATSFAPAPATAEPPSGHGCAPTGRTLRYLVDLPPATTAEAEEEQVTAACGRTTVYYPQIAVAVATSADPRFGQYLGTDRSYSAQAVRLAEEYAAAPGIPPRPDLAPTDPAKVPTADLSAQQWDMRAIDAPRARALTTGSRDVVVGVLDSGIDADHPDLARAVARDDSAGCLTGAPDTSPDAWLPTTSPHGTHVAGIIAAADDGKGVTGVAPGVRIASVKVVGDRGDVDPEAAVCGLMWAAAKHMKVVNASFSVDPLASPCAQNDDHRVMHEAIARAVEYATSSGTLTVTAATNEGVDLTPSPRSGVTTPPAGCEALPAGLGDVVAVSAVDGNDLKTGYSSYGLGVIDVAAPGGDAGACVLSTVPGGYGPLCGTSMAAPHVSGVVALLASLHPGDTPSELRRTLDARAKPLPCPDDYDLTGDGRQDAFCTGYDAYNGFYGHGMADALAAVAPAGAKTLSDRH